MLRRTAVLGIALTLAACGGDAGPPQGADGGDGGPAAQAPQQEQQQQEQARRIQELEDRLSRREQRIGELEARVQALEDSLSAQRSVPSQLVSSPRFGCTEWAQDPAYLLCTGQTLASKP